MEGKGDYHSCLKIHPPDILRIHKSLNLKISFNSLLASDQNPEHFKADNGLMTI